MIGPVFVVVQLAPLTKFVPVKLMPEAPFVVKFPLKVVVPLPAA